MKIALSKIRTDGETQMREKIDQEHVDDLAEAYANGKKVEAPSVYHDGVEYWLVDGFHRVFGAQKAGLKELEVQVSRGMLRDAQLAATGANGTHGLKRTNGDKRKAVQTLLNDSEWCQWSDRKIAEQAGVSNNFVAEIRKQVSSNDTSEAAKNADKPRVGKDGKRYSPKPKPAPETTSDENLATIAENTSEHAAKWLKDNRTKKEIAAVAALPPENQAKAVTAMKLDKPVDFAELGGDAPKDKTPEESVVKDSIGRTVPDDLREKHEAAALLSAIGRDIDKVRRSVEEASKLPGGEFMSVAEIVDALKAVKRLVTDARYWSDCPRCQGKPNAKCVRCEGHGYWPHSRSGMLSDADKLYLGIE